MKSLTTEQQIKIEFAKAALSGFVAKNPGLSVNTLAQQAWTMADEMMAVGKDIGAIPREETQHGMDKDYPPLLECGCHPAAPYHHCKDKGEGSAK